jgi:hypothetical protein
MSVNQNISNSKVQSKEKRSSMNRPQSGVIDGDFYGFRSDVENDCPLTPAYKTKLFNLFRLIEKEFDILYQENQTCKLSVVDIFSDLWIHISVQDKIEVLNEKIGRDTFDKPDCVDFENNISKVLTKKCKIVFRFKISKF